MKKGYYLVVGGHLATRHETLEEAQHHMYLFLQRSRNVEVFLCEVFPREHGISSIEVERIA